MSYLSSSQLHSTNLSTSQSVDTINLNCLLFSWPKNTRGKNNTNSFILFKHATDCYSETGAILIVDLLFYHLECHKWFQKSK